MPVSVVVGGQFGSEGKGKVALEIARQAREPVTLVRVGGPNSGHTGYDREGRKFALRQLPAGCIDRTVDVVFPAGSYIDVEVLLSEIDELSYPSERIKISHFANIITPEHKAWERDAQLAASIGSTGSGVGAAVMASVARESSNFELVSVHAAHSAPLQKYLCDTSEFLRGKLLQGERAVVEGTQGFGLSLLEGGFWPKATSRSTTAAGALSEAGLSPVDVDDVTLVVRSYPIRVAGDSGPLTNETTWEEIAWRVGSNTDLREYTTVTKKLRRVGEFDAALVKRALDVNHPTRLVMNHLDYVGSPDRLNDPQGELSDFIDKVESSIGRKIDWYGFSPLTVISANRALV